MTKLTTILTAAALTGVVGFTALSPALAVGPGDRGPGQERGMYQRGGAEGGILRLVCSTDGAERLENGLSHISDRVELTDEQNGLFETFKTAALAAQADFAANCVTPVAQSDDEDVDLIDRMQARQANMSAHLAAMESVMPSLEAFFDSLTDDQKADLRPDHGDRSGPGGHHGGQGDRRGPGDVGELSAPDGQNGLVPGAVDAAPVDPADAA